MDDDGAAGQDGYFFNVVDQVVSLVLYLNFCFDLLLFSKRLILIASYRQSYWLIEFYREIVCWFHVVDWGVQLCN